MAAHTPALTRPCSTPVPGSTLFASPRPANSGVRVGALRGEPEGRETGGERPQPRSTALGAASRHR